MLGRTVQNKDKHLVNHVKKVISAHQRQKFNNSAMLEHTKTNRAKQRAKLAMLGRTIQNKDKHLYPAVNHVKKVISAHEGQKLNSNAMLEHTKTNQAKQRARIASPGSMVQKHAKQLKYKHALRAPLEK